MRVKGYLVLGGSDRLQARQPALSTGPWPCPATPGFRRGRLLTEALLHPCGGEPQSHHSNDTGSSVSASPVSGSPSADRTGSQASLFPECQTGPWLMFTVAQGRLLGSEPPYPRGRGWIGLAPGSTSQSSPPTVGTMGWLLAGPKGEHDVLSDPRVPVSVDPRGSPSILGSCDLAGALLSPGKFTIPCFCPSVGLADIQRVLVL